MEISQTMITGSLPHIAPNTLYPCTDCGLIPRSRAAARDKMKALADGAWIVRTALASELKAGIPRVGRPVK